MTNILADSVYALTQSFLNKRDHLLRAIGDRIQITQYTHPHLGRRFVGESDRQYIAITHPAQQQTYIVRRQGKGLARTRRSLTYVDCVAHPIPRIVCVTVVYLRASSTVYRSDTLSCRHTRGQSAPGS